MLDLLPLVITILTCLLLSLSFQTSQAATARATNEIIVKYKTHNNCIRNPSFYASRLLFQELRGGAVTECATLADVDQIVTDAALQGKLVVIDFTATWCGPCKMVAPIYEQLSEQFGGDNGNVVFLKVDVDDNSETAMKYSVSAMPTFLFIHKGEVVDRVVGANVAKLQELIQEFSL